MPFDPDKYLAEKTAGPSAPASAGFDPDKYLAEKTGGQSPEQPGMMANLGNKALNGVAAVGNFVDRFTGAPVRSAIGAMQDGANPVSAYMGQFGENPENAPTGKEIAQKAGVGNTSLSDVVPSLYSKDGKGFALKKGGILDPTASGVAGLGIDIAADPLNLIGVGEVADVAKMGAKAAGSAVGKGIEAGAKVADAVTGVRAASGAVGASKAVAKTTANVAEAAGEAINHLLKPSIAKDAKNMEAIADKFGIDKSLMSPAHEFGDTSSITRLQRTIAEGSLGQKYLDAHNAGLEKTSQALDKEITKSFGHVPETKADAGELLKGAIDNHVSKVFDNADITYKSAAKQFPGLQVNKDAMEAVRSKVIGMQREAKRIARTSADPTQLAQASNLEKWSNLLLNSKGSYKEMSEIVQNIGKAAYAKAPLGQIPSDVKKLRELYDIGSESLIHSIRKVNQNAADRLIVNNAEIGEMLTDRGKLGKMISESNNPEKLFSGLIERGGSTQIDTLKKILPPEQFNAARGKYLQSLIKYSEANGAEVVNFAATRKALEKNAERLGYMFSPEELQNTSDLLKFGERYGNPVMSSSGTGASHGIRGFVKNLTGAAVDENSLEYMKAKARGVAPPAAPAAQAGKASAAYSRPLLRSRGAVESRLKVAQSAAPSTYARPVKYGENNQEPEKGPAKWANDGAKSLKEHSRDPASIAAIDAALKDKSELLHPASDLKPGSKAMDALLAKIRKKYGNADSRH